VVGQLADLKEFLSGELESQETLALAVVFPHAQSLKGVLDRVDAALWAQAYDHADSLLAAGFCPIQGIHYFRTQYAAHSVFSSSAFLVNSHSKAMVASGRFDFKLPPRGRRCSEEAGVCDASLGLLLSMVC
jgi:hypothetical protein